MKKCSVCGVTEETNRIVKLRYEDVYLCETHREQLKKNGKIVDHINSDFHDNIIGTLDNRK